MNVLFSILDRVYFCIYFIVLKIIYRNSLHVEGVGVIKISSRFVIQEKGKIHVGKSVGIRSRCEFSVSEDGIIHIGNNVFFNNSCMIISHKLISIGSGTKFGPNVLVYDHDYDYKNNDHFITGIHNKEPINIGKNCWIGAGTIILRGTNIGDNCVIAAGCVIKGKYPKSTLIVQKRTEFISQY